MEWKNYKLSEIGEIVGGATPSTKISEYYDGDIPWISPKDLSNFEGKYISCGSKNITELGFNSCSCKILPKGSVLFSSRAPIGYIAIAKNSLCTNQGFKSVIPNRSIIDSEFLYYTLVFNKEYIKNQGSGTTFMEVSGKTMGNIEVSIPVNLSDQRKIAGILSALDAKIENNNKINANLETQAEALFKSWFVDFTPFKDQPFVDSELGPIPQGWKVGKLGDYVEIKRGGSPRPIQKFLASQGLNWLKISDATSTQSPFIFNIKEKIIIDGLKKTVVLKEDRLVLSNSATPCIPKFLSIDSCIHDGWLYFPHSQLPENYLYLFFKLMRNNLVSKANGSVFLNLKTDIVKNQVFAFSGEEIYNSFDKIIAPLFKEIENLTYETFQLSALRDTLLPKLMSGEIKL